jgi:cytochrome P450
MSKLPPGPSVSLLQTLRYLQAPYDLYQSHGKKYGDPMTLAGPTGAVVITWDPEGIRTLLSAPPERYTAYAAELLAPVLGRHSMILQSGEEHRRARKLLSPPFHGERMRLYGQMIQECTRQQLQALPAGQPFSVMAVMQQISIAVIVSAVFGVTDAAQAQLYKQELVRTLEAVNPAFLFITALRRPFGGRGPWARFCRQREQMQRLLFAEFASRRRDPQPRQDILSLLLLARYEDGSPMGDEEIGEQLMTLLAAGHETTAIALSWALYLLGSHPEVLERLCGELQTLGDNAPLDSVAALPFLEAVCNETLRLRPITPIIGRTLAQPMEFRGYQLPAGIGLGASILLCHYRPDLYPEPERFLPERFLGRSYTPFEFLPFGGGVRRCIGSAFALYEMKLVLATVLRGYRLSLADAAEPGFAVRSTTVGPRRPILMQATPR